MAAFLICEIGDLLSKGMRGIFSSMSDKDVVMETVRQMPETATAEQICEEIAIFAAIRRGEAAADSGQVTSHEEVRQKLASWISK